MGHAAAFGLAGDLLLVQPAKGAKTPSEFLAPGSGIKTHSTASVKIML